MAIAGPTPVEIVIPPCPVCGGLMEVVYARVETVTVCVECHTGMSIPRRAWIVRMKKRLMEAIFKDAI